MRKIVLNASAVYLLFLLVLLPFIQRPWFFDDSSVLITAQAARAHPLHPYHYQLNLAHPAEWNWPAGGSPAYTHPPLSAWLLAPWTRLTTEIPLHGVMFFLALMGLGVVTWVSRPFVRNTPVVILAIAFTPAYFLTSLTLYPHLFYFVFAMATVYCALRLAEDSRRRVAIGLGLLFTLAALSLHSWPLLAVLCAWIFWEQASKAVAGYGRRMGIAIGAFLVLYGGWCVWEIQLHGMPHWIATYHVRATFKGAYPWAATILPLIFFAGSIPFTLAGWWKLWQLRQKAVAGIAGCGVVLGFVMNSSIGGFSAVQSFLLALLFSTGLVFIVAAIVQWKTANRQQRFLILWLGGELLFIQKFLTYPTGHHFLMAMVPAALLWVSWMEEAAWPVRKQYKAIAAMAMLTLCLAVADFQAARVGPWISQHAEKGSGRNFYWGNGFSGYTYYLDQVGWEAFDSRQPPHAGDRVLVPQNLNAQGSSALLKQWPHRLIQIYTFSTSVPLRTLSLVDSAGWYSSSWGALPFSFSMQPIERFLLIEYTRTQDESRTRPL